MDIGDWVFLGLIVISGIASVSKAGRKKVAGQPTEQQTSTPQDKSDADEWIKKIIRESTKGFLDDDEFIPKNESKPTIVRPEQPTPQLSEEYRKKTVETAKRYTNAEQFRRNNQSMEGPARSPVSLEHTTVVEGNVSHTGLRATMLVPPSDSLYEQPLLHPANDLHDADEVRKAVIYGEILRTKF